MDDSFIKLKSGSYLLLLNTNYIVGNFYLWWVLFFVTFGVILFLVAYGEKLNKLKIKFLNNFEH